MFQRVAFAGNCGQCDIGQLFSEFRQRRPPAVRLLQIGDGFLIRFVGRQRGIGDVAPFVAVFLRLIASILRTIQSPRLHARCDYRNSSDSGEHGATDSAQQRDNGNAHVR